MRSILALLVLSFAALPSANASVILGDTTIDPTFTTTVTILTDAALVPVASVFTSNNVIINPDTAEFALLIDDGTLDTTAVATVPDLSQIVLFAIDLASFTGTSINAIGIPTTPLANTALTEILGLNLLSLNLVASNPSGDGFLLTYNVTSITQVPEPATMWLLAAGGGLVLLRKRYSRA